MNDLSAPAAALLADELARETGCRLFRVERVRIARALREAEARGYERGLRAREAALGPASTGADRWGLPDRPLRVA
jgi:hypothetical protein